MIPLLLLPIFPTYHFLSFQMSSFLSFILIGLLFHLFSTPPPFFLSSFHPSLCDSLHSFLPIYRISSLPPPLLHPSFSRHPMVNRFIFFLSLSPLLSLSLIRPGVFCSIYHLDEALPQFINTLYSRVHTCAQACLRLFLLTCIQ